jgi:DNA helicase-2/ATP-dependent DNA helicase PcrA
MDFLKELNNSQLEAVKYMDGPSLVIAGAGSGKTRVLTYKIAYLLSQGIFPSSIMALTFTNKAAREMRNRIGEQVGFKQSRYLWMGTFHSIFSRILRAEAQFLGFTKDFSIYDSSDSKSLIKSIIKELQLDDKVYKANNIHSRISYAKNNLMTADMYYNNTDTNSSDRLARVPRTNEIYALYAARCKQANAMDFDDLLLYTNILFRNNPGVLEKYQKQFNYILVDEYQDTNFAQYLIVKRLAEKHEKICVVGDDAQSIYSFRGANIDNILKFQQTYQNARLFKLEQNYRSTQNIVNAANSLIGKNSEQIQKTIFSENERGDLIKIFTSRTDYEEGEMVADNLLEIRQKGKQEYREFAVLYRTNSQSRVMEEAFRRKNIPYRIYGGVSFYQRKEIKDTLSYLRLVVNNHDDEALKRIINVPARGIGALTLEKIAETAQLHSVNNWEILQDILKFNLPVNSGIANKLVKFRDFIQQFSQKAENVEAYQLATEIIQGSGLIADAMNDKSAEGLSRLDNIQELLKAIHEFEEQQHNETPDSFVSLSNFLSEVSLLTDQDDEESDATDKVTLMTIHAAKGLEFNTVFIVGMEEDLFPSPYAQNIRELEEERRLFYVAITRAKQNCFISHSKSRFRNGSMNFSNPSRFIKDIDKRFVEWEEETNFTSTLFSKKWDDDVDIERNYFQQSVAREGKSVAKSSFPQKKLIKITSNNETEKTVVQNEALPTGCMVRHAIFGIGKVIETSVVNGNEKAEIDFGEKGKKSLLLKFAKLEVLK